MSLDLIFIKNLMENKAFYLDIWEESKHPEDDYSESRHVGRKSFMFLDELISYMKGFGNLIADTKRFRPEYPDVRYRSETPGYTVILFPLNMTVLEKKKIYDEIANG